ncbi:hypothetical protein O5173_26535, partial [Escherichia coli]|nr:hypothetical protein [Escherichia coli]
HTGLQSGRTRANNGDFAERFVMSGGGIRDSIEAAGPLWKGALFPLIIGLSLIQVGLTSIGGGYALSGIGCAVSRHA